MAETEGRLSERRAIYPGSFDPPTRGHLDVVERARGLFDVLYVAVLENPAKAPLFTIEERVALLEGELAGRAGVRVVSFGGLTSDLARRLGARWIVRGLRSGGEAERELALARSNRAVGGSEDLAAGPLETVFLPARAEVSFIESRLVREIAAGGGDLRPFVTSKVEAALRRKVCGR